MEELLSMGFDAKAADRALRLNGGNVERSIEFLLNDTSPQFSSPAMGTTSMATGTTIPEVTKMYSILSSLYCVIMTMILCLGWLWCKRHG